MTEIFKPVIGYDGIYEISNFGKVKSLARKGKGSRNTDIILSPGMGGSGYYFVYLCKNGTNKMFMIHRLVAINFLDNPENKREVNHINGIKTDNRLENLEWVTPSENILHGIRLGIMNTAKGSQKKNSLFTEDEVRKIKIRLNNGEIGFRIAKELGVDKGVISSIRRGKTWKHVTI